MKDVVGLPEKTPPQSDEVEPVPTSFWTRLRFKLIAPYLILALVVAIAGTFFIARVFAERMHERLVSQLWTAGHQATDEVVYIERELLATVRAIARTQGVADAVAADQVSRLRALVYPIAVNNGLDRVEITDLKGRRLYALHRDNPLGSALHYTESEELDVYDWELVRLIATQQADDIGDKYATLQRTPWGWCFYISGPIRRPDGEVVGVVMVGMSLPRMVQRMAGRGDPILRATGVVSPEGPAASLGFGQPAEVTIYMPDGWPIATTVQDVPSATLRIAPAFYAAALKGQEGPDFVYLGRGLQVGGETLEEAFGSFEARHAEEKMAVFSVALPGYQREQLWTQVALAVLFSLAVLAVVLVGVWLSREIVRPVVDLVEAARRVEQGDLSRKVLVRTADEIGVLSHAFNRMVQGLRVKEFIRDAFGRFVSREVSESLLRGEICLRGEKRVATMLFADIRDFTRLSEEYAPDIMVRILNDYFTAMVEEAQSFGGTVNKFGGDSTLVIFGAPVHHYDHADRAVESALHMRRRLALLNAERLTRGEVPIRMGIGINTGEVVAGTVGSVDRMEYTVIGDAVNLSARVQGLNKEFPEYDILISEYTLAMLHNPERYITRNLGSMTLKGKSEPVGIYAVVGWAEQGNEPAKAGG